MYAQIEKHGNNLNAIFNTGIEPVTLCKKLRVIDNKINALCVIECNTGRDMDTQIDRLFLSAQNILLKNIDKESPLFSALIVNTDPRGYALKIAERYTHANNLAIYIDMGGYGIIAPDFTPNKY